MMYVVCEFKAMIQCCLSSSDELHWYLAVMYWCVEGTCLHLDICSQGYWRISNPPKRQYVKGKLGNKHFSTLFLWNHLNIPQSCQDWHSRIEVGHSLRLNAEMSDTELQNNLRQFIKRMGLSLNYGMIYIFISKKNITLWGFQLSFVWCFCFFQNCLLEDFFGLAAKSMSLLSPF